MLPPEIRWQRVKYICSRRKWRRKLNVNRCYCISNGRMNVCMRRVLLVWVQLSTFKFVSLTVVVAVVLQWKIHSQGWFIKWLTFYCHFCFVTQCKENCMRDRAHTVPFLVTVTSVKTRSGSCWCLQFKFTGVKRIHTHIKWKREKFDAHLLHLPHSFYLHPLQKRAKCKFRQPGHSAIN